MRLDERLENEKLVGLYSFSDVQSLIRNENPIYNRDERYRLRVAAAIGPNDHERAQILAEKDVDVVVIDTAHGHSKGVLDMVEWVHSNYDTIEVIAGNVATGDAAVALRDAGAYPALEADYTGHPRPGQLDVHRGG